MSRIVDRLEGLALIGSAEAGPIRFSTPALAFSVVTPVVENPTRDVDRIELRKGSSVPLGERELVLATSAGELVIRFPVPAPEVTGVEGFAYEATRGVWVVRWPLTSADAERVRSSKPVLIALLNGRMLLNLGEPFVRALYELRQSLGASPVLWVPRVALPHRLALLTYLGVDLVDTTEGLLKASEGVYLDSVFGGISSGSVRPKGICDCPSCRSDPPGPLAAHALHAYAEEMARVRAAGRDGRLRELVEARLTAEPLSAELLRYADRWMAGPLEERTPVVSTTRNNYVLAESHRRPELQRFRERVRTRYRPPPSKTVLLLVPCSRTKPYRNSRSHHGFRRALEGLQSLPRVHMVSVSSPLGLVPQELENVYPACHYDIPVTGEWSEPERRFVADALGRLLAEGKYSEVVVHLDPNEYGFLAPKFPPPLPVRWTISDRQTTSPAALEALRTAVGAALEGTRPIAGGPLAVVREELEEIAAFQFGRNAAELLFARPVRLAGRPWFQRVTDGHHTDLATWREERGLFQLTVPGAKRILPARTLQVEVSPQVDLLGDLFVPGIVRADPAIRAGDAVLLVRDGELLGSGEADLPGPLMTELEHGRAVRVRHRARSPAAVELPIAP